MLLDAIDHAKHVGRDDGDLAPGLDHPRAADQALTRSRRQQVQFIFGGERRLAARRGGRDGGRIVDQKRGDAAVKQAVLLQQFRPAVDRKCATAARQFGQLRADVIHKSLASDIVANPLSRSARSRGRDFRVHGVAPLCSAAPGATTARIAQEISASLCFLGSVRSRPDRKARQKICAGPMIWLRNRLAVIGNNSPRANSGARQRSMPSARCVFSTR